MGGDIDPADDMGVDMKGSDQMTIASFCIDCGKVLTQHDGVKRCAECQRRYKKRMQAQAYERERKKKKQREEGGAVWRNGHPQICRYSGSCKYGSGKDGCSYILAFGRSRVKDGHYIVNGKCDAYKRGKYKADGHITCVGYGGAGGKNYSEV